MRRYHAKLKFVVRSRKMWRQVEVWLDGGVLERTSPFRRTSLVPQIAAYHNKLLKGYAESDEYPLVEALAIYLVIAERVVAR